MNQLTPETARSAVIETARDRLARLEAIAKSGNPAETDIMLAIVILVADILRDVDVLVTEPLLQARKQRLHGNLPRIACCNDGNRLAGIVDAFCADARRILPSTRTFDPENLPW